jgi:hypothetical protein
VLLDLLHDSGDQDEAHQTKQYAQRHHAPGAGIHVHTIGAGGQEPSGLHPIRSRSSHGDGGTVGAVSTSQPGAGGPEPGPALEPLDVDGVAAIGVGTAIWAVLLVIGLLLHSRLQEADRGWWIGVAVSGLLLGLAGLAFVIRRRNAYRTAVGASSG